MNDIYSLIPFYEEQENTSILQDALESDFDSLASDSFYGDPSDYSGDSSFGSDSSGFSSVLDTQASSDYTNRLNPPSPLSAITTELGNEFRPFYCMGYSLYSSDEGWPQVNLIYADSYTTRGFTLVYAYLRDDGTFQYISGNNYSSSAPSSLTITSFCSPNPYLYLGVVSSSDFEYPTMVYFRLISIGIVLFIFWSIYKLFFRGWTR